MTGVVLDEIRRIVADILNLPLENVTTQSSLDDFETWDSLQHLNLVLALEQNSGLRFTPDEIERMLSVPSITALIEEKLSHNGHRQQ